MAEERTEPATPRRKQDAREKGQVAKSLVEAVTQCSNHKYFAMPGFASVV